MTIDLGFRTGKDTRGKLRCSFYVWIGSAVRAIIFSGFATAAAACHKHFGSVISSSPAEGGQIYLAVVTTAGRGLRSGFGRYGGKVRKVAMWEECGKWSFTGAVRLIRHFPVTKKCQPKIEKSPCDSRRLNVQEEKGVSIKSIKGHVCEALMPGMTACLGSLHALIMS
ncbi:hypothetical protein BU17DRAFT_68511 [Hysterangium stoloniferum]|nr:hypothetical protein BU17DRAFT_68511 [Hysterangium stoloniferum]